jgi:hypothetical protein
MHRLLHLARRQEQVGPPASGIRNPKPSRWADDAARDEIELGARASARPCGSAAAAVALHRGDAALEHVRMAGGHAETLGELHRRQRRIGGAERLEDLLRVGGVQVLVTF